MTATQVSGLIRQYFSAYERKDRDTAEALLSDDFTSGSPHDPHTKRRDFV
jgi:ketosteroid isomerase-like protein